MPYTPPTDRLPNGALWQRSNVGVEGGIPTGWTVATNIPTSDDTSDRLAVINGELYAQRGLNKVIVLGAGDFYLNGAIQIAPGTILRGTLDASGNKLTRIFGPPDATSVGFLAGGNNWSAETLGPYGTTCVTADRPVGSTTLSFSAPPSGPDDLAVGSIIEILQKNDCPDPDTTGLGEDARTIPDETTFVDRGRDGTNDHAVRQVVKITNIVRGTYGSGTYDVTFTPALRANYYISRLARVRYQWATWQMQYGGLEDVLITNWGTQSGNDAFMLLFDNAQNCWAKNVEINTAPTGQIQIRFSKNCEVRHCYNHGGLQPTGGGGGGGYGIDLEGAHDCLIEDNILSSVADPIQAPILIDYGSTGNVVAYNYIPRHAMIGTNMVEEIAFHSADPMFNLIEGNICNKVATDNFHGGNRNQTVFRNWIKGNQNGATKARNAVVISESALNISLIGNVIGSTLAPMDSFDTGSGPASPNATAITAYSIGWATTANGYRYYNPDRTVPITPPDIILDARVVSSLVRHGNWTSIDTNNENNPSQIWDSNISDHQLPNSYYLSSKPSFFGSLVWPPIDPSIGMPTDDTVIPAGYRAINGTEVPSGTSDTTPPTVSITAPSNNATVGGTTTLSATASDDIAIGSVQFKVDGANFGSPLTSSPYQVSLDTTALTNGSHTISAVATDTSANSTISTSVTVNVNNLPAAPSNTVVPTLSNQNIVGHTITVTTGTWIGSPTSYTYQWKRCNAQGNNCSSITSATSNSYQITNTDIGYTLVCEVTAINAGGSTTVSSAHTTSVVAAPTSPSNTVAPSLNGVYTSGGTITVSNGTWTGNPTPTFTYQWSRCDINGANCNNISGATSSSYVLQMGDIGYTFQCFVTGTNSQGAAIAFTPLSAVITQGLSAPTNNTPPTINNNYIVNQTITLNVGSWSGNPTPTFAYQWKRCDTNGANCTNIAGATNSSYIIQSSDVGHRLSCQVVAANSQGTLVQTTAPSQIVIDTASSAPPSKFFAARKIILVKKH